MLKVGRLAALLLGGTAAACGGGGGGAGPPAAAPAPPPAPPAPPPPPTAPPPVTVVPPGTPNDPNFVTQEYRDSIGAANAYAVFAYQRSATGAGVTAAVIDSGINPASPEFAGRILPASRDVVASRPLNSPDGHGNAVAGLLAAAKDDRGIHGVAYAANLLILRADSLNSCNTNCTFPDSGLAAAVDIAVAERARVINVSLGGGTADPDLVAALARAARAGVVTVISGGNGGGANPDSFAQVALDPAVEGMVVIAGAANEQGVELASFADRAGIAANHYIAATGESLRILRLDGGIELGDGASYSTPLVAGAVALLAQAFPNLTGRQIIDLLYASATDTGAPGIDPVNGRGALNLTRAFAPQGPMALAGGGAPVSLAGNADLSAPMGDAASGPIGATALDGLGRAYTVDLARTLRAAAPDARLAGALLGRARHLDAPLGGLDAGLAVDAAPPPADLVRLGIADTRTPARALAATLTGRLGATTAFAFGAGYSGAALGARLDDTGGGAFLVADAASHARAADPSAAAALRHVAGGWGLALAAERGEFHPARAAPGTPRPRDAIYTSVTATLDHRLGPLVTHAGVERRVEADTLLGARFGPALGLGRGTSTFVDLGGRFERNGWTLAAAWRQGWTRATLRGVAGGGDLVTAGWSAELARDGVLAPADRLGLRLAQPLRVESGGLALRLPGQWDYAAAAVTDWRDHRLDLAPRGRALDAELAYVRPTSAGWRAFHLFWRRDPGHFAGAPDDWGAAFRLTRRI